VGEPAPVACTLSAAETPRREAQIRALNKHGLLSVDHDGDRAILRFRAGADLRRRIDEIVEAESRCCAFLEFQVRAEHDATLVIIAAPRGGEATLRRLADLFTPAV
jgi:hypothetical protein